MGGDLINAIKLVAGARDASLLIFVYYILTHLRLLNIALRILSFKL